MLFRRKKLEQVITEDSMWQIDDNTQDHLTFEVPLLKAAGGVGKEILRRQELGEWLRENIGMQKIMWDLKIIVDHDQINHDVFLFLNEDEAMAFKLMWL